MKFKLAFIATLAISQSSFAAYEMYSINVPADARAQIDKQAILKDINETKKKGYIEKVDGMYDYLNNVENRAKFALSNAGIKNTELVKNPSEIVMASKLKSVPSNAKSFTIGYAAVGTFVKDAGWTGLTEIFKSDLGTCQFTHFDFKASSGGYSLPEENERRDVNDKYTTIEVTGNIDSGFSYEVNWYEDLNKYTLNCINKNFSKEFTQKVIDLAKKIDNS